MPGFKDRVGFPFFAPIPSFVPFTLRDIEGFCGAGVFIGLGESVTPDSGAVGLGGVGGRSSE